MTLESLERHVKKTFRQDECKFSRGFSHGVSLNRSLDVPTCFKLGMFFSHVCTQN